MLRCGTSLCLLAGLLACWLAGLLTVGGHGRTKYYLSQLVHTHVHHAPYCLEVTGCKYLTQKTYRSIPDNLPPT